MTTETETITLTDAQNAEMRRLKQYFPYRIVWGMFDKLTGEFSCSASYDKRAMNREARNGHTVFILS